MFTGLFLTIESKDIVLLGSLRRAVAFFLLC